MEGIKHGWAMLVGPVKLQVLGAQPEGFNWEDQR